MTSKMHVIVEKLLSAAQCCMREVGSKIIFFLFLFFPPSFPKVVYPIEPFNMDTQSKKLLFRFP